MKTQLPEKLGNKPAKDDESNLVYEVMDKVDQLIDCLAELTEVVEGKQDEPPAFECNSCAFGKPCSKHTHTLKETLLGEINKQPQFLFMAGGGKTHILKEDVEAIINRLMP